MPLWRLLDMVAEDSGYEWRHTGQCLVFHHTRWYDLIAREIPDSLVIAYRKKLEAHGQFTLEEVAALMAAMAKAPEVNVPEDLRRAGLLPSGNLSSFFTVPISADQLAKARSSEGLSIKEMSQAQRAQLAKILKVAGDYSMADFDDITLAIRESPYRSVGGSGTEVALELKLWRDHPSVIVNSDSFQLPWIQQPPSDPSEKSSP